MTSSVLNFSETNFQTEVLQSNQPVLVDFTAAWCPPCKMLAPTIDEIANEYAGRVRVGKLDADESPGIASQYNVSGLPTVIVFKNGQPFDRVMGLAPKAKLVEMLDKAI